MVVTYGTVTETGAPLQFHLRGVYCDEHAELARKAEEIEVTYDVELA